VGRKRERLFPQPSNKTERTFEAIRRNLTILNAEKPKAAKCILANVIFSMNFMETEKMLDFALEVGADGIYFTVVDSVSHRTDGLLLQPDMVQKVLEDMERIKARVDALPPERGLSSTTSTGSSGGSKARRPRPAFTTPKLWIGSRATWDGSSFA